MRDFLDYRRERLAAIAIGVAGTLFTVPSLALFSLMIPIIGLGFRPALAALVIYSMLPILRNTIAGLRSVDPPSASRRRGWA